MKTTGKFPRRILASLAVMFVAAGILGGMNAAYTIVMADIREAAIASQPERFDFTGLCLEEAERRQMPVNVCEPFTGAAWQGMTVADPDMTSEFTFDAHSDGTSVRLPDGTFLWIPLERDECPRVTLADTVAGLCMTWVDMGTDD